MKEKILECISEIIESQKKVVLETAQQWIPNITPEDILQPNDYTVLENNPLFRYEEGALAGMQTIQTALFAFFKEHE